MTHGSQRRAYLPQVALFAALSASALLSGCGAPATQADEAAVSNVTAISIALPPRSKLPPALALAKLAYCFQVQSADGTFAAEDGAGTSSSCERLGPHADGAGLEQFGPYTETVAINAKLKRGQYHALSLKIGEQSADGKIVADKVYYSGFHKIRPDDMQGKDRIPVVIQLTKVGGGSELPNVITTTTPGEVDVDVSVRLPEGNGGGGQQGQPAL